MICLSTYLVPLPNAATSMVAMAVLGAPVKEEDGGVEVVGYDGADFDSPV